MDFINAQISGFEQWRIMHIGQTALYLAQTLQIDQP
jgi:hypothetical protein